MKVARIITVLASLGLLLFGYNHCVHPEGGKKSGLKFETTMQSNTSGDANNGNQQNTGNRPSEVFQERPVSLEAFADTVYPLTRARCATCHAALQPPLHASATMENAHDQIRDAFLANFNNPASSRLAAKLVQESHNCWSNCSQNAAQMEAAITAWAQAIEAAREAHAEQYAQDPTDTTPGATSLITDESRPLEQLLYDQSLVQDGTFSLALNRSSIESPMRYSVVDGQAALSTPSTTPSSFNERDPSQGRAIFNIRVSTSGDYYLWGRVKTPSNGPGSFYARLSNQIITYEWLIPQASDYQWAKLTHTNSRFDAPLALEGDVVNVFEIRHRHAGTSIAEMILTDDPDFDPATDRFSSSATLEFDLSRMTNLSGSKFLIDVEEYDEYSYKFSRPRISLTSGRLQVKNIQLIMNGVKNPQNATYTLIDASTNSGTTILSERAMIVLKDQGANQDRFQFEFEGLEQIP